MDQRAHTLGPTGSAPERCPICERDNECGVARGDAHCWCFDAGKLPGAAQPVEGGTCLCRDCAAGRTPSPCIGSCRLNAATGECVGCLRTAEEIERWSGYGPAARRDVFARLRRRRSDRELP